MVEAEKPVTSVRLTSDCLNGVGFFFTLTVFRGTCMARMSMNRVLNAFTLSSGSLNTSMIDQGPTERSSSKLDFEKNVKE